MKRRSASARSFAWALPLLAVVLLAAGCARVDDPDGWAAPIEADDTLFLSIDDGKLAAVEAETFDQIWEFPDSDEQECGGGSPEDRDLKGIYGTPVVADGVVYFGAWDGFAYAIDAAAGECLWDFESSDPILGGMVVDSGNVYVASTDGTLYMLDAETGEELERVIVGDVWSTPLLLDGTLYVGTMAGKLRAFDAATLEEIWDTPFSVDAGLLTDPTPLDGSIIVGGIGGKLYAVDAATGEEQWVFDGASNWYWGAPLVAADEGLVYATNMDTSIYAVDIATGESVWEFNGDALFRAGAALAGDIIVAVDDDGNVWGLDAATGEPAWNGPTELEESAYATPFVLTDEAVLIVARNGDVFSVNLADGRLTTIEINS